MTFAAAPRPSSDYGAIAARIFADVARTAFGDQAEVAAPTTPVGELVKQIMASTNPFETGGLMRMLDDLMGGRVQSNAVLNGQSQPPAAPKHDASSLYGANGPRLSDIQQTDLKNCYYVAVLGALANEKPSAIRNAISYDAATQSFNVRLFDSSGNPQRINVTQAEIDDNITRGGGSRRDDGAANAAIWPDVMEVAYVKQFDTNYADGLDEGHTLTSGGFARDSMRALTGSEGREITYNQQPGETRSQVYDRMGNIIKDALKSDKPVALSTDPETTAKQDGLQDNHVYTVTGAYKDISGKWQITMRNPWATNVGGDIEGKQRSSAFITISLDTLVRTGGLEGIQIGR